MYAKENVLIIYGGSEIARFKTTYKQTGTSSQKKMRRLVGFSYKIQGPDEGKASECHLVPTKNNSAAQDLEEYEKGGTPA